MGKRLDITPKIAAAIERSTEGSVDPNDVAVFETIAFNTLPVSKKGSIFQGAVASEGLIHQMADLLNGPGSFVPLHNNHDQGYQLPIGRAFAGEVRKTELGTTELRALFYLPLGEDKLIEKIETGAVEEVSVGVATKMLTCSECGWDYLGEDATPDNLWLRTCANDHTIGVDGTHLRMTGLDTFYELSIVARGAAQKAKIQTRAKAVMGKDYAERLAATGVAPEATILFASPTEESIDMAVDLTTLVAELTEAKADNKVKVAELQKANETIAALTKTIDELKEQVKTLEAAADTKLPEVQEQLKAAQTQVSEATQVIRAEAERLSVAASLEKPAENATITELSTFVGSARTKLATMIPAGGVSQRSETGSGKKETPAQVSSYKTR